MKMSEIHINLEVAALELNGQRVLLRQMQKPFVVCDLQKHLSHTSIHLHLTKGPIHSIQCPAIIHAY